MRGEGGQKPGFSAEYSAKKPGFFHHRTQPFPTRLLRFGFQELYTHFAFLYDTIATVVSLGEWQAWGRVAIQFIGENTSGVSETPEVLELAYGPGHLHLTLRQAGYNVVGIDLSAQMSALASQRLQRAGLSNTLARANVFALPFPDASFDTLISTFPTEFIHAPQMLSEATRVLKTNGQLVVISAAPLHNTQMRERAVQLAYRVTRGGHMPQPAVRDLFAQAGRSFTEHRVPTRHADVIVWVGVRNTSQVC